MRKKILTAALLVVFSVSSLHSQDTCESEVDVIDDLNSIATKCTVEKTEKTSTSGKRTKKLSVHVSSSVRYLKKRKENKAVSGIGTMNTSGLELTKPSSNITSPAIIGDIAIPKVSNIQKLKEKLSQEQLHNSFEFENVDVVPAFNKCESVKSSEGMNCFNEQMIAHIQEHFNYPQDAILNKIQGNVWIRFVIDEEGSITNLKTLAPKNGTLLKQEAERVVSQLPVFIPAKKDGKNVLVKYGFPINFSLQD